MHLDECIGSVYASRMMVVRAWWQYLCDVQAHVRTCACGSRVVRFAHVSL